MATWVQKLQQYNFTIHHRRGRLHGNVINVIQKTLRRNWVQVVWETKNTGR